MENIVELKTEIQEQKIPKKRGRRPGTKSKKPAETKVPKKRGRKPLNKKPTEPKIPKKRGRKPKQKDSILKNKNCTNNLDSDNVILHLPINSKNVIQNSKEAEILTYNPNLNEPEGFQNKQIAGQKIDNVVFLKNDRIKDSDNFMANASQHKHLFSHYPFDEKKKVSEIVNFLENDKNDKNNDINSITLLETRFKEREEIIKKTNKKIIGNNWYKNDKKELELLYIQRKSELDNFNTKNNSNIESTLIQFKECNKTNEWPISTSIYCWWCCHPFDTIPCSIPYKYIDDTYFVYGVFCSPECSASYIFDESTYNNWEKYSLLNMLYREMYGNNIKIKLAPPKQTLRIFGGNINIKDFRLNNINYENSYKIIIPPMQSIIPQQELTFEDKNNNENLQANFISFTPKTNTNDGALRLKRSIPFKFTNNTLEKCMNLNMTNTN